MEQANIHSCRGLRYSIDNYVIDWINSTKMHHSFKRKRPTKRYLTIDLSYIKFGGYVSKPTYAVPCPVAYLNAYYTYISLYMHHYICVCNKDS